MTKETSTDRDHRLVKLRGAVSSFVLVVVVIATGALVLRQRDVGEPALSAHVEALPESAATCPDDGVHALHAARAALHGAEARLQRYPFAPRDGRHALARFAEAFECARLAGDDALRDAASARLKEVRATLERDVRDHAQRYALLRQHDRMREAADDIAYLTELGWPERGALAEQLRLDREALEAARTTEKKR